MKQLREAVEVLSEYMYGTLHTSSYPGPSPSQLAAHQNGYSLAARAMMFPELEKEAADKKKFKDKYKKKRDTLRKLALWLQQKDVP